MVRYIGEPISMSENNRDVVLHALTIPSYERGVARLLRYDRHP